MWAPELRTPGMASSSLLTCVVVRSISAVGGARRGHPVDQEVAFLEGGEQRLAQVRVHGHADDRHQGERQRTPRPGGR